MWNHLVLMQNHAKAPCFDAKTPSYWFKTCKNIFVLMQKHAKTVAFAFFCIKNVCFCIHLHQKRKITLFGAFATFWIKNMCLCIFCTKTKCFCIVLHQKRQITLAFNKHLCSDAKTCKNYCFCILFYQKCVLLHDLYQNNQCFCTKTRCFCII